MNDTSRHCETSCCPLLKRSLSQCKIFQINIPIDVFFSVSFFCQTLEYFGIFVKPLSWYLWCSQWTMKQTLKGKIFNKYFFFKLIKLQFWVGEKVQQSFDLYLWPWSACKRIDKHFIQSCPNLYLSFLVVAFRGHFFSKRPTRNQDSSTASVLQRAETVSFQTGDRGSHTLQNRTVAPYVTLETGALA